MRALVLLIAGLALRAETPRARIYIVTRAANVEARAVLSGRLVGMNASSLQWIENSGVVRAELPQDAVDRVKSDKDVVLVLNSEEPATAESAAIVPLVSPTAGVPGKMIMPVPGMDAPGMGMSMGGMGTGAMGLGAMGMGMPMGGLTNMIDLAVGSLARKLVSRPPSCRITVKNAPVNFGAAGGDGVLSVTASGSCVWQAQATVDWIKINSGSGVSGAGVVSYTVKPGARKVRSGAISIVAGNGGLAIKGRASLVVTQAESCCGSGI
jgi:hypothetical protein